LPIHAVVGDVMSGRDAGFLLLPRGDRPIFEQPPAVSERHSCRTGLGPVLGQGKIGKSEKNAQHRKHSPGNRHPLRDEYQEMHRA
jgi:hypothetical protein